MKYTDNFNFSMPEPSDKVLPTAFNENAAKLDAMLAKSVRMAYGTYVGNGGSTGSISTPGFVPKVVIMFDATITTATDYSNSTDGWSQWLGEDLAANYYESAKGPDGSTYTVRKDTTLQFTATDGKLAWKLGTNGLSPAAAVNNYSGKKYQWLAFGYPSGV